MHLFISLICFSSVSRDVQQPLVQIHLFSLVLNWYFVLLFLIRSLTQYEIYKFELVHYHGYIFNIIWIMILFNILQSFIVSIFILPQFKVLEYNTINWSFN